MININAHMVFVSLKKTIEITIVIITQIILMCHYVFSSIMIAYDNHQCAIHFLCIADIDCSTNLYNNVPLCQKSL